MKIELDAVIKRGPRVRVLTNGEKFIVQRRGWLGWATITKYFMSEPLLFDSRKAAMIFVEQTFGDAVRAEHEWRMP